MHCSVPHCTTLHHISIHWAALGDHIITSFRNVHLDTILYSYMRLWYVTPWIYCHFVLLSFIFGVEYSISSLVTFQFMFYIFPGVNLKWVGTAGGISFRKYISLKYFTISCIGFGKRKETFCSRCVCVKNKYFPSVS